MIIGRDAELAAVEAFLDRPVEGLRALVLEGGAGIGKSTIWQAGVAAAGKRSFRVLVSRPAEAERTLPYVVLGDLFAQAESGDLDKLENPRRRAFESALLRAEADLPVDPRALGVAIVTLMMTFSGTRPLVLAIDDDQWMDASSAATLGFALRRSRDQPVLILVSRRVGDVAAATAEEWMGGAEIIRLRVGELSVGAIQALVRDRLDVSFPRPTLLRLHEASGGNPFYALELARARTMDPTRDLIAPFAVPPTLERLVAARLDSLDASTSRAILLIAAHGRMPIGTLHALEVPSSLLEPALDARVIESARDVVSFSHPLLASAIYQRTSGAERRAAHLRLATALDDPVDRGRHLALASDEPNNSLAASLESAALVARDRGMPLAAAELAEHSTRFTPTDAPGDRHRRAIAAARAHMEAGEGGRARTLAAEVVARASAGAQRAEGLVLESELEDVGPAVALLEEALIEAAGIPALEAAIHAGLADAGRATKGSAWAEHHAREALQLAERLEDGALRARALAMLAQSDFEHGVSQAFEHVEQAHLLATSLADPNRVSWADEMMGLALTFSGDYERAREWLLSVFGYWRDRDEQVRSVLTWLLALAEVWAGRWSSASEYAAQVRDISLQYGEAPTDHLSPALIALHRGQIEAARDHSQRALSLAEGHLLPQHIAILGVCDLWSGSPAAAVVNFIEAEQTADLRGWHEPNMRWWRAEYAEALLQVGRLDDATRLVLEWETAAARLGRQRVLAQAVRIRGLIAAALGDVPTALALLEKAADRHESAGDPFNCGRALLALGGVRLRARQKRTAREALEAAITRFEALGATGWAATARGELARVGGRERIEGLSPSEMRVAELVAEGRTNREIAAALFLGERTVAGHLTHVYAKLGIRSRTELARHLRPSSERFAEKPSKVATS